VSKINKKLNTIFALILIAAFVVSMFAILPTNAQSASYRTKKTYAMIGVLPNPVGVEQKVYVWFGMTDYLENESQGWKGITISVTYPDGKKETLGPFTTAATGQAQTTFIPTEIGNYTFQSHFPAQWLNWTGTPMFDPEIYGKILYQASDSDIVTLAVQQEPVQTYPFAGLPTEYWSRPINAQLPTWYSISGNWLSIPTNRIALDNDMAPESSHILWSKPLNMGGLSGGTLGDKSSETGDAYEGKFANTVVLNGILYYNRFAQGFGGGWAQQGISAVDIKTGEEIWFKNNSRLAFGQAFFFKGFNMRGVFDYIYTTSTTYAPPFFIPQTTWNAYDALTGEYEFSISNIPSTGAMFAASTLVTGPNGEFIIYNIDLVNGWIAKWNSTTAVLGPKQLGDMSAGSWGSAANTQQTFDGTRGYDWNKTLSSGKNSLPGSIVAVLDDRVVGCTASGWTNIGDKAVGIWAFSLKDGQQGQLLYNTTWSPPSGDLSLSMGAFSLEDKVFTINVKETRQIYGFSLDTGQQIWGPTASQDELQIYSMNSAIAYGKLLCAGYGGVAYCYNASTGAPLWQYTVADPYHQSLWNNWPMFIAFFADDKVYLTHHEHSPQNPLANGAPLLCLDMTSGSKIWQVPLRTTDWGGGPVIGDSIMALWNSYDGQVYALGKGKSATTVTAPDIGVPAGSSAIIRGTVTDQSPGALDTPAISDEAMDQWMQYLYMQFPRPSNATGVPVSIDTIDPNGNFIHIGDTTSDSSGTFSYRWLPPSDISGQYTIIATFAGSKSYWPSFAETSMSVDPAPASTITPTAIPVTAVETYFLPAVAGIIFAIIIVGAVLALLMLRKRP
jgi:hypothetical protein